MMFRFTQDDFGPLWWCPGIGQPLAAIVGDYAKVPKYIACDGNKRRFWDKSREMAE